MKYYQIRLVSLASMVLLAAGSISASGWAKAVKCADKKVQKKYYVSAAEMYEKALGKKKLPADSMPSIKARLANTYSKMGSSIKAENNYADAVKSGKADAITTFNFARSLQANGKYQEAKEWFDKIASNATVKDKMPASFSEISQKAIEANHHNKYDIQRTAFNTPASEYAPAYNNKGIVFTSNMNERGKGSQRIMWNKEPFTDLYSVSEDAKGDIHVITKLPVGINSKLNDGAACFNAAGDEIYFTRNNKKCKKHDQLLIYTSKYNGTNWSHPTLLSFEMPGTSYAHPSLAPDGNTLYFSSDLAGSGYGGMDIYMSRKKDNGWEAPTNLGKDINTTGNETFPFLSGDNTLYFTSDGWPGYGGMDIFYSKMDGNKYGSPENMGAEFNSQKDDLSLIIDSKNHKGYFASNRDGDDDIFSFMIPAKMQDKRSADEPMKSGKVVEKTTGEPIAGARVEISNINNPMGGKFYYTDEKGTFYYDKKPGSNDQIKVYKDKFQTQSISGGSLNDAGNFEVNLEKEKAVDPSTKDFYQTTLYYDVNKSALTAKNMELLGPAVDALKSNPNSILFLSGFADERGGDMYNYGLSARRVKEAIDYLFSRGIDMLRIRSSYYGGIKVDNDCRKKPKCVEDADTQNRRVEVKVANP